MSVKDDFTISMGGVDMASNRNKILDDSSKVAGNDAIAELLRISGHDMLKDDEPYQAQQDGKLSNLSRKEKKRPRKNLDFMH